MAALSQELQDVAREAAVPFQPHARVRETSLATAGQEVIASHHGHQLEGLQQGVCSNVLWQGRVVQNQPISVCTTTFHHEHWEHPQWNILHHKHQVFHKMMKEYPPG